MSILSALRLARQYAKRETRPAASLLISGVHDGRVVVATPEALPCNGCGRAAVVFVNAGGKSLCSDCDGRQ